MDGEVADFSTTGRRRAAIVVMESIDAALAGASGVCQCSPVGMAGHPGTPFPPELLASAPT